MKRKIWIIFTISCAILFVFSLIFNMVLCKRKFSVFVNTYSKQYEIEPALVYAVIKVESDFDCNAVSKSGAVGLMQILPKTAKWIAKQLNVAFDETILLDRETNIRFGCFYLRYLFDKFDDFDIVVCAYNAGEGKVLNWIQNGKLDESLIDYAETKNYLSKVKRFYNMYKTMLAVEKF